MTYVRLDINRTLSGPGVPIALDRSLARARADGWNVRTRRAGISFSSCPLGGLRPSGAMADARVLIPPFTDAQPAAVASTAAPAAAVIEMPAKTDSGVKEEPLTDKPGCWAGLKDCVLPPDPPKPSSPPEARPASAPSVLPALRSVAR